MSATAYLSPETTTSQRRTSKTRTQDQEKHIALRVTVCADRRRILDALTIPEYVEAWLTLPCDHAGCRLAASQRDGLFRFDHHNAHGLDLSISGAYRVCRRGKLFFTWRKWLPFDERAFALESMVVIRLYGAFSKSTLCLAHTGFFSENEYLWHGRMWERSLEKLQSLFQPRS
jgi:hypothetical protein